MVAFSYTAIVASALSSMASAHLFISSPTPIEGSAPKDPLDPSGSNFPCHGVSLPTSGGQKMAAGSTQKLAFELGSDKANTAVHGGGSCQLSLTYETDPAKVKDPSNWHVIYSIEGGCPSNTKGNLVTPVADCTSDDQGDCMNSFDFDIPDGVKSGHAILAWTWFNNVGNREMYMNCANVDITGGTGADMDSLPAMFVANLASVNTCPTQENTAVAFPNPGNHVMTHSAANGYNYPIATPTGAGCAGDGGAASPTGSGSDSSAALPDSASAAPTSSAAPAYSAPAATSAPAYSAPVVTSAPAYLSVYNAAPQTVTTMATVTSAAPSAAAASAAPPAGKNGTSGSNYSDAGTACTNEGGVVCIGTSEFGICDHGNAVARPLAAGTTCSGGVISKKRMVRHVARHFGHHAHKF